ncbi:MAG: hypothetical protein KJ002_10760 [Candidatus Dadabacteria bacterium]|nr:hypothetical protein [Candidatus Dadabacteria bacterium]
MTPVKTFSEIRELLSESGFNIFVKIKAADYDGSAAPERKSGAIMSGAKSIILVGFGGSSFWKTFNAYLDKNPVFRERHTDLIDSYTVLNMGRAGELLDAAGIGHALVYPFGENALGIDFVTLGRLGGAGVESLLGILIHPVFGTWISLRAAIITDAEFAEYDRPLEGFNPCPPCEKPCIAACPAHTVSESGWDWKACMEWRLDTDVCSERCASRVACPWGSEERYGPEQMAYHHSFVLKSVRAYFAGHPGQSRRRGKTTS